MLVKVISKDGKMYTLPDKLTTKAPEGMTEEEKVEFLDAIKNVNITNLNDGASNGLAKVAVTEQNMNSIVLTTNQSHTTVLGSDYKTLIKLRAYTIIPKGASKKIEFTLKQDGDLPFGLYLSTSGLYDGSSIYSNGILLSIPNNTLYGENSENENLSQMTLMQMGGPWGSNSKYMKLSNYFILGGKSFTTPYPSNAWNLGYCLDFLGGEKFKTEGCRLILEEVEDRLTLTNKKTTQSVTFTRRTDVELQGFDFLFVSILPSRGNADITQSSAVIENLKYIN